jgi:DNA polymerase III delta subunit
VTSPIAYFWGDDTFAIERAVDQLAQTLGDAGDPLQRWTVSSDDSPAAAGEPDDEPRRGPRRAALDEIEARVLTAPLFGGGTLVVVRQPASLVRSRAAAARVVALIESVPPGNGLAFTEVRSDSRAQTTATEELRDAVRAAKGTVAEFRVPGRDAMDRWIAARANELGIRMGPGAARLLAERVGAYVREGDVDRRNQSLLANGELEKLALYRPGAVIDRADVDALVPDAVPGSVWAFLDAIAARRSKDATLLAERLLSGGTPLPVLVSQLHRRIRELLDVRDRLSTGTRPHELPRAMKIQPYRAQKLAEQAGSWTLQELEDALDGLLALDLETKGIAPEGHTMNVSDERAALGLEVWITDRVARDRTSVA